MTEICRSRIDHPSAWTGAALGDKAAITRKLSAVEIAGFDALLAATRRLAPQAVTRDDFSQPAVDALAVEVKREIMEGRGLVLLAGLDPDRYSAEDLERIYWGFGQHLGRPTVQSRNGDRLGRVEEADADPVARGYRSSAELNMHTDPFEIVGLMCVRQAASGGQSALVSSLAIHNEILRERPELLDDLYAGFHMAPAEAAMTGKPVTDERIPVYSFRDGKVSCLYTGTFMHAAAKKLGVPLPGRLEEALAHMAKLAQRDDLALRFMLEPGEFLLWHNFLNLHSRTNFQNDATHKRLLLRLWLKLEKGRPVAPEFFARGRVYERVYEEHRPQPAA